MTHDIEKLQLLVMDHETTIETLSREYHQQQIEIEALQLQVRELVVRLKELAENLPPATSQGHEVPPHY